MTALDSPDADTTPHDNRFARSAKPRPVRVPTILEGWTLATIRRLLTCASFEDRSYDWKRMLPPDPDGKERLIKGAVGMANAGGGFFVFGVADAGVGAERLVGMPTNNEFAAHFSDLVGKADPAVPHECRNPPLRVDERTSVYVAHILSSRAPHSYQGVFHLRTAGGTVRHATTSELREMLQSSATLEAPGLDRIMRVAWRFNRAGGWESVGSDLTELAPYVSEGTPNQQLAALEALSRLATFVRRSMPDEVAFEMIGQLHEAMPSVYAVDDSLWGRLMERVIEVAGHIGYDATLYLQRGTIVIEVARILSECVWQARKRREFQLEKLALDQFRSCENAALRASPSPFNDAATWLRYEREQPSPTGRVPPPELSIVEARLFGLHPTGTRGA